MKLRIILTLIVALLPALHPVCAQEKRLLTLQEAITLARDNSPAARSALHTLRAAYWSWRSYRANYLPQVSLSSSPYLNRSIESITLNDGSESFVHRNYLKNNLALSINQNIALTGGNLFIKSEASRLDIFESKTHSYSTTPLLVGYSQDLFGYNSLKWQRRTEPLRYRQALKSYAETMELIAAQTVNYFFQLAQAQTSLQIARANRASADTLYRMAQGRYEIGTITENDILQLHVNKLNEETNEMDAIIEVEEARKSLCSYLGLPTTQETEVVIEDSLPHFEIPVDKAYELAVAASPDVDGVKLSLLSSESNLADVRADARLKASIYMQFGLTQSGQDLADSYRNPTDAQYVSVGLTLPILDWGRSRGKVRVAKSNLELAHTQADQTLFNFEQNIYKLVHQFNMQGRRVQVAFMTDSATQRRYEVARHLYLLGRSTILDLNSAITEKDAASRGRVSAVSSYWQLYYTLRSLTQYDFERGCTLENDWRKKIKD